MFVLCIPRTLRTFRFNSLLYLGLGVLGASSLSWSEGWVSRCIASFTRPGAVLWPLAAQKRTLEGDSRRVLPQSHQTATPHRYRHRRSDSVFYVRMASLCARSGALDIGRRRISAQLENFHTLRSPKPASPGQQSYCPRPFDQCNLWAVDPEGAILCPRRDRRETLEGSGLASLGGDRPCRWRGAAPLCRRSASR